MTIQQKLYEKRLHHGTLTSPAESSQRKWTQKTHSVIWETNSITLKALTFLRVSRNTSNATEVFEFRTLQFDASNANYSLSIVHNRSMLYCTTKNCCSHPIIPRFLHLFFDLSAVDSSLVSEDEDCVYFCGNSLGLMPKSAPDCINRELDKWAKTWVTLISLEISFLNSSWEVSSPLFICFVNCGFDFVHSLFNFPFKIII